MASVIMTLPLVILNLATIMVIATQLCLFAADVKMRWRLDLSGVGKLTMFEN